jgi:hypothetical protein
MSRSSEALGEGRCADLPAEHAGPRGFRRCRTVFIAVVASTSSGVVARGCPRLRFARLPSADDVAGVAVLRLPTCVEESFLGRCAPRVGGVRRCSTRMHRGFGPLRAPIIPRVPLLADAGRRALGLLDGRLLDELLCLTVQVSRLGCRGGGHGPQQRYGGNELLAHSRRRFWVVDVEIGVNAVAGLCAQLPHGLTARRGFPCHRGAEQPHRPILFRQLGLELAGLGQLRVDVDPRWG